MVTKQIYCSRHGWQNIERIAKATEIAGVTIEYDSTKQPDKPPF